MHFPNFSSIKKQKHKAVCYHSITANRSNSSVFLPEIILDKTKRKRDKTRDKSKWESSALQYHAGAEK